MLKSLLPENSSHQLQSARERRRPCSFDEYQSLRKKESVEGQEKRESSKESEVQKREKTLMEVLKCKMWESLEVKARYPKKTKISVDVMDYEDALLWSHLFDQEDAFLLFWPSTSSSSSSLSSKELTHHKKRCIWKSSILSPSQVGDWLSCLLKCFQDIHCVEVMLHTGVIQSDPLPLDVSLNYHECASWKSTSVFGEDRILCSLLTSARFSLDVSFRISCINCQYVE